MTWNQAFDACDANQTGLSALFAQGPAVTCTPKFYLLPLRYAVVGGDEKTLKGLPFLSNEPQVGSLKTAGYAVRTVRPGFLYVLVKRNDKYKWEASVRINEYGSLEYLLDEDPWRPASIPAPQFDPKTGKLREAPAHVGRAIALHNIDDIQEVRMLYTPDPLTPRMKSLFTQAKYYKKLQRFDVKMLAYEKDLACIHAPDVLPADKLASTVADFAIDASKPALHALLQTQAYSNKSMSLATALAALGTSQPDKPRQGVAVILHDPIGITQELNTWRNQSMVMMENYLQQKDGEGIENQRKHTIALAIENLERTVKEQTEQQYLDHERNVGVTYSDGEYSAGNANVATRTYGNYRVFRNPDHQKREQDAAIAKLRKESWDEKYAPCIDEGLRQAFLADYKKIVARADAINIARAPDHKAWLTSQLLLDAFQAYDTKDARNGELFEYQLGAAVVGMNATEEGDALLTVWSEASNLQLSNLFWRGLAKNQEDAVEEIKKLLTKRSELPSMSEESLQALTKALADIYDKGHALVDTVNNQVTPPPLVRLSGAAMLVNTFGTKIFQGKGTQLDKPLNIALAWALKARLGKFATDFRLESRGGKPLGSGSSRRLATASNRDFNAALMQSSKNTMLEIRLGSTLALLQVWNFKIKAEKLDKGSREYVELMAAAVVLSAAGLELGATAVSVAERSTNTAVRQAAATFKGGLRLGAGVLAGGAAMVGAVFDALDMNESWHNKNRSLALVYLLRATAQTGAAFFSTAIGLAAAGPFLEYLLKRHATSIWMRQVFEIASVASSALSLRMAFMLRWCFRINIAIFVLTIIIEILRPNPLKFYLEHSTFRKNRKNGTPKDQTQELKNLQSAIEGTF